MNLRDKAQSETVGVILVIAITMLAVGVIYATGMPSLNSAKQDAELERVGNEFALLDSEASSVALGRSSVKSVSLNTRGGDIHVSKDAGWINFTYFNLTKGRNQTIYNESMGSIVYTDEGDKVGYQGGGVWLKNSEGDARMISPPEFNFNNRTLTFPLVKITNDWGGGGPAQGNKMLLRNTIRARSVFSDNPLEHGPVYIELKSEFCEGWENYFIQETSAKLVSGCGIDNRLQLVLDVPPDPIVVKNAITTHSNALRITVGQSSLVDSYNSSEGPYLNIGPHPVSKSTNGNISAVGKITVENKGVIKGDVKTTNTSSDSITLEGKKSLIEGTANTSGEIKFKKSSQSQITEGFTEHESIDKIDYSEIENDAVIEAKISKIRATHDNNKPWASCINSKDIKGSCTLQAGEYYLENPTIKNGETLRLDTSTGRIEIAVNGTGQFLVNKGLIDIDGDNRAVFYVNQTESHKNKNGTHFSNGKLWTDHNQTASKSLIRVHSSGDVDIEQGNSNVTGIIYAPGSDVFVRSGKGKAQASVFGAVIADTFDMSQGGAVHYDEALGSRKVEIEGIVIAYLHITENGIDVNP